MAIAATWLIARCALRWPQAESGRGWKELLALGLHYGWYLGLVFSWLPAPKAALFLLLSQMFAGFLLSIVFVQARGLSVDSTASKMSTLDPRKIVQHVLRSGAEPQRGGGVL